MYRFVRAMQKLALLFVCLVPIAAGGSEQPTSVSTSGTVNEFCTPYSDLISGQVRGFDRGSDAFSLESPDGHMFRVELTPETLACNLRNLGEPKFDCSKNLRGFLKNGRNMSAHGTFYPEGGICRFEGQKLYFLGTGTEEVRFEEPDWWINQIRALSDFYLKAQFPDGKIDFRQYRTNLKLDGDKRADGTQEADTISRLVYGFSSAYLLTGEDRYLEAAQAGTTYLRDNFRKPSPDGTLWYHALEMIPGSDHPKKHLASTFLDDLGAIPLYEQIYALAGPVQNFRITGDPAIMTDVDETMKFFETHFRDQEKGGFFSHIDPLRLSPLSPGLGKNKARKNWNSIGDHAPAYLINYYLGRPDAAAARLLNELGGLIVRHFPGEGESPFVRERFKADWRPDESWGWQKDRAVIGHNLKIAWNLVRLYNLASDVSYLDLAERLGATLPSAGADRKRGGWFDVVERRLKPGTLFHRFVWNDRKAWWQQEQAILAYLILAGVTGDAEALRLARESAAFYNLWFLDHDDGGVYYNVTADGLPYLRGDERQKGSHSMSGYHSFELCYLATVYTNLLIRNRPLDLYFKPVPGAFRDGLLRVAPDLLPPGRVRLSDVQIEGKPWLNFDPVRLTVRLPDSQTPVRVKVRLVPTVATASLNLPEPLSPSTAGSSFNGISSPLTGIASSTTAGTALSAGTSKKEEKAVRPRSKRQSWFSRRLRSSVGSKKRPETANKAKSK
ncbi:MAG: AGE family epimerase/isomerase [Candidatus Ozemobacteraceae bacterium]